MKVMSIFGTRPEMIKMWSTLRKLDELGFEHIMVHTGQNFTPEMKDFFFQDLELRKPDYELSIDTSSYAKEVADVIVKSDDLMEKIKPDALLILGDTYSGLSVMPASTRGIKVFHMEAGLRAWDCRMPEQRNRVLIDHMSHINLPYNHYHRENLIRENLHPSKIFVTGNPTFEVMRFYQEKIEASDIDARLGVEKGKYVLVTAHRSENVDNPSYLSAILDSLQKIHEELEVEVVFPMHPRTQSKLNGTGAVKGLKIMNPLGFYDFNKLMKYTKCIVSDSGTSPEESYFYKVPCVSVRMTTERPETLEGGGHIVAGMDPTNIVASVTTAVRQEFGGRYELEDNFSPSSVVVNCIQSQITNFF